MDVIKHYDGLIDIENDPYRDPPELSEYMDKWDGKVFVDMLNLSGKENVLEIGIGTGRLAAKIAPMCKNLLGIDISPKTARRARENLHGFDNVSVLCADFLEYSSDCKFDTAYSSLVSMHFCDKKAFFSKVYGLLKNGGMFLLSIDKNQSEYIDMGEYSLRIYPDSVSGISENSAVAGFVIINKSETEFAHIFLLKKR